LSNTTKESRNELAASLKSFEEKSSARIQDLTEKTIQGLDKNRAIVDNKLAEIQKNNDEKLEKMRETVEEKLQKTLESRIGESFKQVSENLERVQKGLGEMQNLATDVGGLKNVLSNIRSRGSFGEFQLENIIEEMLEINQYEKQCLLTPGNKVDFAINIPSKEDEGGFILLPIDAKFPTADYDRLTDAYHNGNKEEIDRSRKALAARIEDEAKSIRDKYIVSPKTTDFAIMFLPFESLYAEVLQIPGLLQKIQSYKITIAGPTTIFAFLTSLQMGFKTLNVNKRTGEISKLLSEVKQEFGKFENAFKTAKQKIDSASQYLEDEIGKRTRKMARTLKTVDTLPANKTENLLDVSLDDDYEDNGS
jgi:DNA recombination protein RmuC